VVFSVDLNATIPAGTTSITNNVTITDSAGDNASGSRSTPIPPPNEVKLAFTTQPPATGSAGIPLSPPVTVAALDQFNNTFTADSSSIVTLTLNGGGTFVGGGTTVTAQLSSGVATFSNLLISGAGTYTLTATDGLLTSATSASFTIAGSSQLAFIQQPVQTVAGVAIAPAVQVAVENSAGGVITTDTSLVTLTLSHGSFANGSTTVSLHAVNGVATFSNLVINTTGSYNLIATDGVLPQRQSNPFNIVALATGLVFLQQPNNTYVGEAINPSVTVALVDGFGNIDTANTTPVTITIKNGTLFGGATTATAIPVNGVASFNNLVVAAGGTNYLYASVPGLPNILSNPFSIVKHLLTVIDDNNANNTGSIPHVVYSTPTTSWVQTTTSLPNNVGGTITSDSTGGDTATVVFNGTLVTLYAAKTPTSGSAQIFIDGGAPTQVSLVSSTAMIAPVFTSALLASGNHTIVVKVVSGNVSIDRFVVGPATPTLAWATPANLTYGTALNGTQLDAFVTNFASFPGTFTYSPPAGTILPVGANQTLSVTFTPTNTTDYATANAQVLITVTKATPVITWTGPNTNMTFGQALGPAQLNATATVNGVTIPGTFVYTPGAGTVPPTGQNFPLSLTFTPTDTTDYNTVTAQSDVDVDPANPVITWANPASIIDGTPLGATQLNATASVPGTFVYTPAAGTVLPPGQNQPLGVVFTPTDLVDYNVVGTTVHINVNYGSAAKLAFIQQPSGTTSNTNISPAVKVAVEDSAGSTIPTDTSTVTLTLSPGSFTGGTTSVSVAAVNGVATFSTLSIANNGQYILTASDGSLTTAVSNTFNIGATAFDNFNSGASSFTSPFLTNLAGTPGGGGLTWSATGGINDGTAGAAGGGVVAGSTDETAVYTPTPFNLSDMAVHTVSEFLTAAAGHPAGDRLLQIGFVTTTTAGFNGGFSFISARIFGDHRVEFQSGNGTGTSAVSSNTIAPTGTITNGDWLQLVFTTQETTSGSFTGTFSLLDYGPTGLAAPVMVLAPVTYTVSGLTTVGTATTMYAGFRTASGTGTSPLEFDNFMVDSSAAKMGYLAQPSSASAGTPLGPFVASVQDINSNILVGDTSTVTLTLSHGTFANGQSMVSAQAVNGIATFTNLVINSAGSYILKATDTNPNLDPGYAPFTINIGPAATVAFVQQPTGAGAGATITPAVTVAVQDAGGNTVLGNTSTVTLTLSSNTFAGGSSTVTANAVNGVATFGSLVINSAGTYTLTASDGTLTTAISSSFTIAAGAATKLGYLQQPSGAASGATITPAVTVAVQDALGNTVPGNTSTVTLTLSSGTFAGGGNTVTANAVNGVATFANLVINTPGSYTLTASDGSLTSATSSSFSITSGVPTKLGYLQQPNGAAAGATITPSVTVAVQDSSGNTVTGNTSTVTLTLSSATFAGGGNTVSVAAVNGVAIFGSLVINSAGNYTLTASDGSLTPATSSSFTISAGAAAKLAFLQQPTSALSGATITPAVTVAVQDTFGNTVLGNTSTVTLTLSSNTFAGGSSTVTANAVSGVATFGSLAINTTATYTLAASDGTLTGATSSSFTISLAPAFTDNFNTAATDFTSNFQVFNNGGANNTSLSWGATLGVQDQPGPAAGGGVQSSGSIAIDSTAVYTPATVNLSDLQIHTLSMYVTAVSGLGGGDKPLQLGYLAPASTGFNANFNFISTRILGNNTVEFQYDNGAAAATSMNNTPLTGTTAGDWLQLIFSAQETASGSFHGTFSLVDYGPTGVGTGTTVLAPVSWSITGLTNLGTATSVSAGFRTATSAAFTGHVRFDNLVDPVVPGQVPHQISLAGYFNQAGIVQDGSRFTGGLDGRGTALSGSLLGSTQTWNGTPFTLGAAGGNNVVSAAGQTISLPAGSFTAVQILATAVNGNQPRQTFVIKYTDGTIERITQSISSWTTPQHYRGESDAVVLAHRDRSNGTQDHREVHVYGYSLPLIPGKTVSSITLPRNGHVKILALSLV
jgi:hypothetical protein